MALMAMIKEKLKGHKPIIAAAPERGNVINLMDALKAEPRRRPSRRPRARARRRPRPTKPAPRRRQGRPRRAAAAATPGQERRRERERCRHSFGLVGALAAFPRRLAAREVERQGGRLQRGVDARHDARRVRPHAAGSGATTPRSTHASRRSAPPGGALLSENGFLRLLGADAEPPDAPTLTQAVAARPVAARRGDDLDLLALFDAFEHDAEPFSFRDLILARKYAGLIAGGAGWGAIARSVHRFGPVGVADRAVAARRGRRRRSMRATAKRLSELDGQLLLELGGRRTRRRTSSSPRRKRPRRTGRFDAAAALYGRCLALDPGDAVAAFNRATACAALGASGRGGAGLCARDQARSAASSRPGSTSPGCWRAAGASRRRARHLHQAIALDPGYADAIYNLATLEFDAGDLGAARRWWVRYLELDARLRLGADRRARRAVRRPALAQARAADVTRISSSTARRTRAATILLAHGAGAPMDSRVDDRDRPRRWRRRACASRASSSATWRRGAPAGRKPPPRAETLMPEYLAAVAALARRGRR